MFAGIFSCLPRGIPLGSIRSIDRLDFSAVLKPVVWANKQGDRFLHRSHDDSLDGDLRSFRGWGVQVSGFGVLMQPDVVLYHNKKYYQHIYQSTKQPIFKKRNICERNQTRTCEYTTMRDLMRNQPGFNYMEALPLENGLDWFSVNRQNPAKVQR